MRRVLNPVGIGLGIVAAMVLAAAGGLFIATSGVAPVPATVTEDPSLPRRTVDDVMLHVSAAGPKGAPVIVVLHGGPGADHRALRPLDALSDDWRVVFYDQRGAGLSERLPASELTLDLHVTELHGLLARISPDRPAILLGHSWGAILATAYLGRHTDRVRGAVLIEPGFLDWGGYRQWQARADMVIKEMQTSPSGAWLALRAWFESLHLRGPDSHASDDHMAARMIQAFANHPDVPYSCPGTPYDSPVWRVGALASSSVSAHATRAGLDEIAAGAGRFPGPVLLMAGSCSSWIGVEAQRQHATFFADATLVEIDGAGHDIIDDRPEASVAAIRAFLADRVPR